MSDQHFSPGPAEFAQELDEKVSHTKALVEQLIKAQSTEKRDRTFEVPSGAQTDGTGAAKWVVFESPQGFEFRIYRVNINAINPATGSPYTPAAPYTGGSFALYRGEVGLMSLIDFAPIAPGGNVFPQISTEGEDSAAVIRGERIIAQVIGGPVSTQIGCVIKGLLRAL